MQLTHSIRLYFPYTFDSNASPSEYTQFSNKLADITIAELLTAAPFVNNGVHKKFLKSAIWQKDRCKLDKRIHAFGDKLVNGIQDIPFSDGFFGMQPIRLSNDAIRVLNQGSPSDLGKGLSVTLKPSAVKRMSGKNISSPFTSQLKQEQEQAQELEQQDWPMMFNSVWFYGLNTGIGMMVVDLSFKQPGKNGLSIQSIEELQEINYIISRNSGDHQSAKLTWGQPDTEDATAHSIKGLSGLIDALLPINADNDKGVGKGIQLEATGDRNNTYAYTYLATEQALTHDQRKQYTFRVARKYNELYLPDDIDQQIDYFEPFKPITHAFSLEGAATYVDFACCIEQIPESIINFDRTAIPQAYAPLILLTYAEYIFLREMATNSPDEDRVDMRNPTNENLSKLREFRTKLYDFRLNFRYTQISGNTNHNLFCNTNKKALEIANLLVETSSDAQEIEQYIADHVSQKQEARLKKFGVLGSLFAIIIGWVDLWGLNLHGILFEYDEANASSISIFLAVLVLLAATVLYASKSPADKNKSNSKRKISSKIDNE